LGLSKRAFSESKISKVEFFEGLTYISNNAFAGCSELTTLYFPKSLKSIGALAFQNSTKLASVTLQENLTSIEHAAFGGCTRLATVYNYSALTITKGSYDNGFVGYYATNVYN